MAYEERSNGTHAMTCDTPDCTQECLSPGKQELAEDLNLAGWVNTGKDKDGTECFVCPVCTRGTHPAQAMLDRMTGGTGEVQVTAPITVHNGDPYHDDKGELCGHYTADADQGDPVNVKLQLPDVPAPPGMLEVYDAMLEGSDDDDDKHGRVSVAAPAGVAVGGAVTQASAASPGHVGDVAGHAGGAAGRVATTKLDVAKLDAATRIFDSLDATDTDWDPDGE